MRTYERLRVKKQDRGRHCLFRHGAFLAAHIPFFDRMTQMAVRRKPIVPFYRGCQDHWRLTSDADLVPEGAPASTAAAVVLTFLRGPASLVTFLRNSLGVCPVILRKARVKELLKA